MAPIRGKNKDIHFDGTYPYLDKSLKFKFLHTFVYAIVWLLGFPLNRIRFGLKIEGRKKIRKNRKLYADGVMTVCNHVHRWDMVCVLQAMRFRTAWIPMYAEPFNGKDGFKMKYVGGIPIPESFCGLGKFDEAMKELQGRKQWIHVFPESCSWRFYAPLRPFKTGAFNMAYRFAFPVVPMVITFRQRSGWRKLFGKGEPLLTIHVGDPIVPDPRAPRKQETARIRDLIYHFLWKHFGDREELVRPRDDQALLPGADPGLMDLVIHKEDPAEDYLLLKNAARLRGVTIPPNMTAYLSITNQMLMFGTAVNHLMHDIEDTAVLMPFDAIYHEKKQRHIGTYLRFFHAKKRRKGASGTVPATEDEMIDDWLVQRNRKVKRLLKKIGRKL